MQRDNFIFYLSYKSAADSMSDANKLAFYVAIIDYALTGKEPNSLKKPVQSCWNLVKPIIDSNNKKYVDGSKGGRPNKTSGSSTDKTTGSKSSKPKEEEKEEDKEEEEEKGSRASTPSRRLMKRPPAAVFKSMPESSDRIGYEATENLRKKRLEELEQAAQHTTAKPPDDDEETRELKRKFKQRNPESTTPANATAEPGTDTAAQDSTQAPAPQPSGTQAHDQTDTPAQENHTPEEPRSPPV